MLLITFGMEINANYIQAWKETGTEIILTMIFSFTGQPNIILSMEENILILQGGA